jgi:nicotinamidase-related amidase
MKNISYQLVTLLLIIGNTVFAQLPEPGFTIDSKTAIVITDPQNDFLSEKGVAWGAVGESVVKNKTRENLLELFKVAKEKNILVFVSPHYYYQHDHQWHFEGKLEKLMHNIKMFDRKGALTTEGFEGSGADWLPMYKEYINGSNVIVTSPHKVFGPESNDLALQLRKRGIDKVVLAGMSGNLCAESHMRELLEEGFEVAVVKDATASAILPGLNGEEASFTNYEMMSSKVYKTADVLPLLKNLKK